MEFAKAVPTVTFSVTNTEADVYVERVTMNMWETEAIIATPAGRLTLSSTLIGRHNLPNLLAAVATGLALTIDDEGIPLKVRFPGLHAQCMELPRHEFDHDLCASPVFRVPHLP